MLTRVQLFATPWTAVHPERLAPSSSVGEILQAGILE